MAVIGAGIGGLSAAIVLASRGCRVTVIDQLDRPGGKMGELRIDGYRWDTGPSVITMKHVIERLFSLARRRLDDYVTLDEVKPITRYFWPDGATLDAVSDREAMLNNIRTLSPRDVDGFARFMRHAHRLHDAVAEPFLYRSRPGVRDLLRLPLAQTLRIDAFRTMHAAIRDHVKHPHLVQLLSRFATYNGSSPYQAPATLNVIAHVELAGGAWYPRGGVFALARAYERLAHDVGVDTRYSTRATAIHKQSDRRYTVHTAQGTPVAADAVVVNADYTDAQTTLMPPDASDRTTERRLEPSCSALALLLAVTGESPGLAHHNILFCKNYHDEFDALFNSLTPPSDPTLYLCITSKTEPNHAPTGHENWFALVNAPHISDRFDWTKHGSTYAEHVIRTLRQSLKVHGINPGTHALKHALTPETFQATYGGNKGALYGFSSNSRLAAFTRPPNRSPSLPRIYYASGSAHPGGGVPLVTLSGIAAAACATQDLGLTD